MNLAFSLRVALRYLHASRENRHFSWITLLSILGLTIGVAALIVVVSVFDGFENEVRVRMLQSNSHIIASVMPAGLNDPDKWIRVLTNNKDFGGEIEAIAPFVQGLTMAKNASAMQAIAFRGIDPRRQEKVQKLDNLVSPASALNALQAEVDDFAAGKPEPQIPAIILATDLLDILNIKIGEIVWVIEPANSSFANSKRFRVVGKFTTGLKIYDSRVAVMSLPTAQKFNGMGSKVTGLNIAIKDPNQSIVIGKKIEEAHEKLSVKDWQSLNNTFFRVLQSERVRVGMIVMLVALVAGFNILTAVLTSVTQRQKDISTLKALGASNGQILRIFLFQSTVIGLIGSGTGVILALAVSYILRNWLPLELPAPYFLNSLPVSFSPGVYGIVCLIATTICLFAGIYPAFIAARVSPTEGMAGSGQAL